MQYFDAHVRIGPRPQKHPLERWSLDHVIEDMRLSCLSAALVTHEQAINYEPMHGNLRLCEEIDPYPERLYPCWVVIPHHANDFPEPAKLLRLMAEHNVRAVHIAPNKTGCPVTADVWEELALALAKRSVLVKLSISDVDGFDAASALIGYFRCCQFLLTDVSWGQWRELNYLMRRHANLHIEFSTFQANRAIEVFGKTFGFQRLLFGTDQPKKSPGAARAFVDLAMVDQNDKEKIAGGNLMRLLKVDKLPDLLEDDKWNDSFCQALMQGKPCPAHVLDAHSHILHDGADAAGGPYVMIKGDAQGQMEVYDKMGVDGVAWMSWIGPIGCDVKIGNDIVASALRQFSERAIGLATIDPSHQDAQEREAEIQRCHVQLGFRGLKPYIKCSVHYDAPEYIKWWEFADKNGLYALMHIANTTGGLQAVQNLAGKYPGVSFLIAHTGGNFSFAGEVVEVMKKYPNVFAELTLTPVTNGIIEWLCKEIGPERVLFGTDAPMRDPRPQLGWVIFTRLSERDKRLILGENFMRILAQGSLPEHTLPKAFRPVKKD